MIDVIEIKKALIDGDLKVKRVGNNILLTDKKTDEAIKLCTLHIQGWDTIYDQRTMLYVWILWRTDV